MLLSLSCGASTSSANVPAREASITGRSAGGGLSSCTSQLVSTSVLTRFGYRATKICALAPHPKGLVVHEAWKRSPGADGGAPRALERDVVYEVRGNKLVPLAPMFPDF